MSPTVIFIIFTFFIIFLIIILNSFSKSARAKRQKALAKLAVERCIQIINESLEIISKTKNLSTLIGRYDAILDNIDKLIKIAEDHNCLDFMEPPPQVLKEKISADRNDKLKKFILDQVDFEIAKAKAITRPSSKISTLDKAIVKILEGKRLIGDKEILKVLDDKEAEIRRLIGEFQNK
jgi:hypothetical protein